MEQNFDDAMASLHARAARAEAEAAAVNAERARAARIARVDKTARAFAVRYAPDVGYDYDWGDPKQAVFRASYRFALALERARDEAVKELDTKEER